MDENSLLIPVAMKIIMNSGNARTKANEALEALSIFDFSNAHKKIVEKKFCMPFARIVKFTM